MTNPFKAKLLDSLRGQFGTLTKLPDSNSLFTVGNQAAIIYIRYSKVHGNGGAFFGLRDVDLRRLEGHNSFICFLTDAQDDPLFIPFADFEEIFRNSQVASDGQYKAQLTSDGGTHELYIPRKGKFNVDGYSGTETIAQSMSAQRLPQALALSHSQVQTLLASIGHLKGYDVYVPAYDCSTIDWSLCTRFSLRNCIPPGFDPVAHILSEIDVVWSAQGKVEGLFEVEHSTPVYSGLLRFNDVLLTNPNLSRFFIVSNDVRRELFARQVFRPTFRHSGLSDITSFLGYPNVYDWHARLLRAAS